MARRLCLFVAAMVALSATASCAEPRVAEAPPRAPAWFQERVRQAEANNPGYPSLADVPAYQRETTSYAAWRQGVERMADVREALLNDPNMADIDDDGAADDLAARSRADAARDIERQSID